jgi:hypothetical protein
MWRPIAVLRLVLVNPRQVKDVAWAQDRTDGSIYLGAKRRSGVVIAALVCGSSSNSSRSASA